MQINTKFIMSIKYPHMKIKFKIIYGSDDDEDQSFKITCQRAKDKYQNKYSHMQIKIHAREQRTNIEFIMSIKYPYMKIKFKEHMPESKGHINTKDDFEAEETPEHQRATTTITRPYGGWGGISYESLQSPSAVLGLQQHSQMLE